MIELPPLYVESIFRLLGDEADLFLRSYEQPRSFGLRLNRLKLPAGHPAEAKLRRLFGLEPVPWCPDGCRYDESTRPGRHVYHAAGLYYIQEPSAMIAAELLDPKPGEFVLDLAAAPGGKTTQIAAKMKGEGLLVANEIHPSRAKILAENVERLGIANALVTQTSPHDLSERYPDSFDRVLLDAPCSGEGMFRKDPQAAAEWSPQVVEACAARQRDILPHAARLLKPGGTLVYSTCTFNTLENEETIAWFLKEHPEFSLVRQERLWPHRGQGEGHFAALLRKSEAGGSAEATGRPPSHRGKSGKTGAAPNEIAALKAFDTFARETLPGFRLPQHGIPLLFGESLYWLPQPPGSPAAPETFRGLRVHRPGLHLGDLRKGRFEPAHALAMAIASGDASLVADYAADSAEAAAYWRGETLPAAPGSQGWGIAAVEGFPLGWFKAVGGQQKNRLPKGLRFRPNG